MFTALISHNVLVFYNFRMIFFSYSRCGGGSVGEYCQDMTSVCDILSNIDVCINGKCQNHEGTASCQCKTGKPSGQQLKIF